MKNTENVPTPLLTADDVAQLLGLSRRAILYFARMGIIPAVRIGRYVKFDAEQIQQWVASGGHNNQRGSGPTSTEHTLADSISITETPQS